MPGANDVNAVDAFFGDQPIQVRVDENQAGARSPMACDAISSVPIHRAGEIPNRRGLMSSKVRSLSSRTLSFKNIIAKDINVG